jgi:hypothetical protein
MPKPKDWLRFIQTKVFEKCWVAWDLTDDDLRALEMIVMINPDGPPVIPGTGGVRKVRFSSDQWSCGKSKGARVYYVYVPEKGTVFLLFVHMRDEEDFISAKGKEQIRKLVSVVVSCLENGR